MSVSHAQVRTLNEVTEPVHAILYFAGEVQDRLAAFGMEPRSEGYVTSRAAPMGPVGPEVAAATFFNFHPALFHHTLPAAWEKASPTEVLAAREAGLQELSERVEAPTDGLDEITDLAVQAMDGVLLHGRPLAAANAGVPLPDQPFARAWQALAVVREHRGDGHIALLTAAGLSPAAVLVLMVGWQDKLSRRFYQATRLWDDDAWAAAEDELRERGLFGDDALTEAGVAFREQLEADTDRLAAEPYRRLGAAGTRRLFELLQPLAHAIGTAYPREPYVPAVYPEA